MVLDVGDQQPAAVWRKRSAVGLVEPGCSSSCTVSRKTRDTGSSHGLHPTGLRVKYFDLMIERVGQVNRAIGSDGQIVHAVEANLTSLGSPRLDRRSLAAGLLKHAGDKLNRRCAGISSERAG